MAHLKTAVPLPQQSSARAWVVATTDTFPEGVMAGSCCARTSFYRGVHALSLKNHVLHLQGQLGADIKWHCKEEIKWWLPTLELRKDVSSNRQESLPLAKTIDNR
eukprot:1160396-Pelagomonas_calceolata.AAC.28